jgi:hypothetical protein
MNKKVNAWNLMTFHDDDDDDGYRGPATFFKKITCGKLFIFNELL